MSAIITNKFRIHNAISFKEGFSEAAPSRMYLFVGRSYSWDNDTSPDTPKDTISAENVAWKDMIAMKAIGQDDVSHGLQRRNWVAGKYYDMYRDNYDGSTGQGVDYNTGLSTQRASLYEANYYVINDQYEVYKCLNNRANGNTIQATSDQPYGTGTDYAPFTTSDGYRWQYMYTVSPADIIKYTSSDFIPVKTVTSAPPAGAPYYTQYQAQNAAVDGSIDVIEIVNGGTGYTGTPTVQIFGDGSGCTATAVVSGGSITGIVITNPGSGYKFATAQINGTGSNAVIKPIISPAGGHGKNAVEELGGYYIIMNSRLEYADGGDFPIDNDYRRIGIIKDPLNYSTTTVCTDVTRSATYSLTLSGTPGTFQVDEQITQGSNSATATVVSWDSTTKILKYIKTATDNYTGFTVGQTITGSRSGATGTIGTLGFPEVQPYSGSLIYYENRRPISRADDQIEDIKIIVEM